MSRPHREYLRLSNYITGELDWKDVNAIFKAEIDLEKLYNEAVNEEGAQVVMILNSYVDLTALLKCYKDLLINKTLAYGKLN
jgi:hypothetical protein